MLMNGRRDLADVGRYRTHPDPMQIVSGPLQAPRVHFEAPLSDRIAAEMAQFIAWFNETAPSGAAPLPAITRAGLAHLWFETIHPFEDGNGRLGRAIAEKALAQSLKAPTLIALAETIHRHRKNLLRRASPCKPGQPARRLVEMVHGYRDRRSNTNRRPRALPDRKDTHARSPARSA